MLERLRRSLEYLNKKVDRGRTTKELTRCAVINGGTFDVGIITTLGFLIQGGLPFSLICATFGISCIASTVSVYQEAQSRFIRNKPRFST